MGSPSEGAFLAHAWMPDFLLPELCARLSLLFSSLRFVVLGDGSPRTTRQEVPEARFSLRTS